MRLIIHNRFSHVARRLKPSCAQSLHVYFSSSSAVRDEVDKPPPTSSSSNNHHQYRHKILTASLEHVHQYGWTEESIAQGVLSAGFPPTYIGMVNDSRNKPLDLIAFFMEECNSQLEAKLKVYLERERSDNNSRTVIPNRADILEFAIRTRLEMVGQYINSKRWHEGMALGAMYPSNAMSTAAQLEELVDIIIKGLESVSAATITNNDYAKNEGQPLGQVERVAVGAVYISTELHMLTDTSEGFEETWSFLHESIRQLDTIATEKSLSGLVNPQTFVLASAMASSMSGAVLSLVTPATKTGISSIINSYVPQIMEFMQQKPSQNVGMTGEQQNDTPTMYHKDYTHPFENANDFLKIKN